MAEQSPDKLGLAQAATRPKIGVWRDVLGGTDRMREKGEAYLPKFEMEEQDGYRKRLDQAVFYNASALTLEAFVGMVLRTDPTLASDLPDEIVADTEAVDPDGNHLSVFTRSLLHDAFDGVAAILVDMVPAPDVVSLAEERAAGVRPYWVRIPASSILRASGATSGSRDILSRFAFREEVTVPDSEFGEKVEARVRDYRLDEAGAASYRIFAKRENERGQEEWQVIDEGVMRGQDGNALTEIPVSFCYTDRVAIGAGEPPLMDLARENIDHYQQRSEHRKAWQYARIPIQVYPGMDLDDVVIAPDRGICTPTPEAKPYYMETSGAALAGSKDELLECERRMANLGAQMLFRPERSNETATARRIENAQGTSRLSSVARALQDCLEEAIRLHALWRGLELPERTKGRWVTVNQDFEDYELDAQMVAALDTAVGSGHLRLETFLTALRDGVKPLSMLDPEAEAELLASEMPAAPLGPELMREEA